jgi:hypothetical protein
MHSSSGTEQPTSTVSEADVIIVAARLRGLNALKDDYGQIQHEKVRKALAASSLSSTPAQAAGDQRQDTRKKLAR